MTCCELAGPSSLLGSASVDPYVVDLRKALCRPLPKARSGIVRLNLAARVGDRFLSLSGLQARAFAVEGEAQCIQDRRLAGARITGDGEKARRPERL